MNGMTSSRNLKGLITKGKRVEPITDRRLIRRNRPWIGGNRMMRSSMRSWAILMLGWMICRMGLMRWARI